MKHRVAQRLLVFSLGLLLVMAILWVRSYSVTDFVGHWTMSTTERWALEECRGVVSTQGRILIISGTQRQTIEGIIYHGGSVPPPSDRLAWIPIPRPGP
jgi:hypothetical protein